MDNGKLRLNIGAGESPFTGPEWINLDRKFGDEALPIQIKPTGETRPMPRISTEDAKSLFDWDKWTEKWVPHDNIFTEVYASHILEHFGHADALNALREWVRVLKPGGRIRIAVPNFAYIAESYLAGHPDRHAHYLFGGQVDPDDFHQTCFDEEHLTRLMEMVGLTEIKPWKSELQDCASLPVSLNLEGIKGEAGPLTPFPKHRRIVAVMSMPRLAFSTNLFCALQAFTPLQIPFEKVEGAWWDQCLERVMLPHINDGTEYLFTLDYDAAFTLKHVHQLAVLMEENPDAGAICPIQFKRGEGVHLFRPLDAQGNYRTGTMTINELDAPLTPIGWGHFGLTIFRTEALRKMSHPWFMGKPAPDGTWGDGRIDADITFWEKFRAAGNKLYLANHVGIGHLELMASLPDQNLQRIHVHAEDLQKKWPENARR